ncbi:MAG: hypothetical protein IJ491_10140 [Clostridia bacterium]|nr:hypothetical protein [Clostridia bacterium]
MESHESKALRYSKREIFILAALSLVIAFTLIISMLIEDGFSVSDIFFSFIIILALSLLTGAVIYQYYNNILEYSNYGFTFKGTTYSYSQATKLVAVHYHRFGTYYHLYSGDEIIYRFSASYENKDDFIEVLQKNGVLIVT